MFKSTRNWLKRNRTTFAVGAGILGVGYLAGQYVVGKITEARQRMSDDRIARENLRRRFEQNQEDCTYTVLALLPTAAENVLKAITVEKILQELQHRKTDKGGRSTQGSEIAPSEALSTIDDDGKSFASSGYVHASQITTGGEADATRGPGTANPFAKKTKLQLWNDLKITSITRAFTLIYTLSLLTLFTRVQLNLLGRRTYLSSVVSLATPPSDEVRISLENRDDDNIEQDYGNDFETNRKYLTFSWWLLHRGWTMIMAEVESAVKDVFGPLTPRDSVTFEHLSELVLSVRRKVEGSSEEERRKHKWLKFILPLRSDEELVLRESGMSPSSPPITPPTEGAPLISPSLRRLLDETSDLVDSPTFTHVLTMILDSSFSLLIDDKIASQAYSISATEQQDLAVSKSSILKDTVGNPAHDSRIQELTEEEDISTAMNLKHKTAKLATLLAVFTRQAHVIGSGGNLNAFIASGGSDVPGFTPPQIRESNEYLSAMEAIGDLEAFAAVVYSSNFEFEAVETADNTHVPLESELRTQTTTNQNLEHAWDKAIAR